MMFFSILRKLIRRIQLIINISESEDKELKLIIRKEFTFYF